MCAKGWRYSTGLPVWEDEHSFENGVGGGGGGGGEINGIVTLTGQSMVRCRK